MGAQGAHAVGGDQRRTLARRGASARSESEVGGSGNSAYEADANGNVATVTDASTHTVSYDYDKLNHLTKITYPDSSYEQFAYP